MIYTTGSIAGNGSTITGTGTNFTAAGSLIRVGCTLMAFTNPVQVLQITAITSGNALSVTPAISPAIADGTKYAILLSDSLSVDGLAQDIAETFGMYQKYMGGFSDVMNGTGDVTITINGQAVTVPGQKSVAKKGANTDITSLGGLTTALSVEQGGTGGKTQAAARAGIGLGTAATKDTGTTHGSVLTVGAAFGIGSDLEGYSYSSPTGFYGSSPDSPTPSYGGGLIRLSQNSFQVESFSPFAGQQRFFVRNISASGGGSAWAEFYSNVNTTKAADGTLKAASPIVKLFSSGRAETNDESQGCTVTRKATGEYLIEGCMGLNADAAWGGIDGGFDIPTDRNKQPLIWLDYEVNRDGSVLVKTYHRTYPEGPEFAQNKIGHKNDDGSFTETVMNGAPVDIPADQFVSVRVEMPANSIWNQKQAKVQIPEEKSAQSASTENSHNK